MDAINNFINSIVVTAGPYVPRLLGALAVLIVAWIIARLIKRAVRALCERASIDARLKSPGLGESFSNIGYWVTWLIALPMLLSALGLTGMLEPVNAMVSQLLTFVPKLLGSAVVLGVGYLVANVLRQIVTGLLTAAGSERFAQRIGMSNSVGKGGLAGLVGTFLFVLVMLPVVAGALQPLGLDSVTRPVSNMLDTIVALLPKLVGAGIIMVFAVVVGRMIANLVSGVLGGLGINNLPAKLGMGESFQLAGRQPAELAGTLTLAGIVIAALTQASEVLGFGALTGAIGSFGAIAAQVLSGLVVLGIGLWLANLASNALANSSIANGRTIGMVARIAILFFAVPLALRQMGLPSEIVTTGFSAIMGALVVAAAIAFGIGGRHAAEKIANRAVRSLEQMQ